MAHVENRGTKAKPRHVAVYQDPDGKRRAKSFTRKLDADRFIASQTVEILRGSWVDPKHGRVTLGDYARQWVDERPIRTSTRKRYDGFVRHLGTLDGVPLGELRPSTMRTWQAGLTVGPATARTIRGVVAAILKSAVVDRLINASPLDGVPVPPKPDRPLVRPMPVDDVLDLADLITARLGAAIVLGAGCGPRRGEAMGLTVDRVDFLRRTVTIDRQLIGVADGRPIFGPLKTAASYRTVPMPQVVADALAAHLATYGEGPDRLIFRAVRGGPATRAKVGEAWRDAETRRWAIANGHELGRANRIPAAVQAKYDAAHPDGPGTRYHHLRHVYASTLIAAGCSVKTVQARLGHASALETLDTYSHLWPEDDDQTRGAVDARLRRADDQPTQEAVHGDHS